LDLISPSVEISIMAIIKFFTTKRVKMAYHVYRFGSPAMYPSKPTFSTDILFGLDVSRNFAIVGTAPIFGHDFNADGRPDLLMGMGAEKMGVFLNESAVSFASKPVAQIGGVGNNRLAVKDIQGDGRADVILWYTSPEREGEIRVFLNRE